MPHAYANELYVESVFLLPAFQGTNITTLMHRYFPEDIGMNYWNSIHSWASLFEFIL